MNMPRSANLLGTLFLAGLVFGACKKEYLEIVPVLKIQDVSIPDEGTVQFISFPAPQVGFVAMNAGNVLFRTQDGGGSWEEINVGNGNCKGLAFPTAEVGFALMGGTLHRTTDGGNVWTPILTEVSFAGVLRNGKLAVGRENFFNQTLTVRVSADNGQTFQTLGVNYPMLDHTKVSADMILIWDESSGRAIDPSTGNSEFFGYNLTEYDGLRDMHMEGRCGSLVGAGGDILDGCVGEGFYRRHDWNMYEYRAIDGAGGIWFTVGENTVSTNLDIGNGEPWNHVFDSEGAAIKGSFHAVDVVSDDLLIIGGTNGRILKCTF